jgi:flagellar basal-body rod protein FlgG
MIAQSYVQDSLAASMANINTPGFKQDVPVFRALHEMAVKRYNGGSIRSVGEVGMGAAFDRTVTDLSGGALQFTRNPTDLALVGDGFFVVQTPQGERLTRAGDFVVRPDSKNQSTLVDRSGNTVLGEKGPISLGEGRDIQVSADGAVSAGGKLVDRLKLVTAPRDSLMKQGANLYTLTGPGQAARARVVQGQLEQSNVDPVRSMVKLITVQRAYDAAAKAVTAHDDTLGKAVNEVGRI